MNLSVLIPIFNQKDKIQSACEMLDHGLKSLNLTYEIIFFDDASRDGSRALLEEISSRRGHIKFVHSPKRLGFGRSLRTLFEKAQGEAVVYADILSLIGLGSFPVLIEKMHDADIVIASRFGHKKRQENPRKSFLFQIYLLVCRFFLKLPIQDIHPKLIFLYREIAPALDLRSEDYNIFPEIFLKARKKKLIVQEFPLHSQYLPRQSSPVQGCHLFTLIRLFQIDK